MDFPLCMYNKQIMLFTPDRLYDFSSMDTTSKTLSYKFYESYLCFQEPLQYCNLLWATYHRLFIKTVHFQGYFVKAWGERGCYQRYIDLLKL
jgi:hypothetical protein